MKTFITALFTGILFLSILNAQDLEWQETNGPFGGDVNTIISTNTGVLIAGTSLGGLYRSTDEGITWSRIEESSNASFSFNGIWDLDKNSLGHLFAATSKGVYRSTDNGESWTAFYEGLTDRNTQVIAVNSNDVIFVGTSRGISISEDNGENWKAINNGLTELTVQSLEISSNDDVIVGTRNGIFISKDNGKNWVDISNDIGFKWIYSSYSVSDDTLLTGTLNGTYISTNGGENWDRINLFSASLRSFAQDSNNTLISGGRGIIFSSIDKGITWSQNTLDRLGVSVISDLLITSSNKLIATTINHGIVQSNDNGVTLQHTNEGLATTGVSTLVLTPSGHIVAGTSEGIFRKLPTDDSWEWVLTPNDKLGIDVGSMEINDKGRIFVGINSIFIYSDDNGTSWNPADSSLTERFPESITIGNGNDVYVGFTGKIFKSSDGGDTWSKLVNEPIQKPIQSLGVSPNGTLFAGTRREGFFRSLDDGINWEELNNGLDKNLDIRKILFLPNGDILLGAFNALFRSTDNGNTWVKQDGFDLFGLQDLITDRLGNLYAALRGFGVAISKDDGLSWEYINDGLWQKDAKALLIYAQDQIYVGTRGGGVFSAQLIKTSIEPTSENQRKNLMLRQNYPNPFDQSTHIDYQLSKADDISLSIYSSNGHLIKTLVKGYKKAGDYSFIWNGQDAEGNEVTNGIYICRLIVGSHSQSRMIIRMK